MFERLREDIAAFMERDPAARNGLEIILCYPGFHALVIYRWAHWLWKRKLRLLARFISYLGRIVTAVDSHNQIGQKRHPTILDRAIIGSGAAVLGPITIGEGARVGANSVVTKDIPASVTAVGIPAKVIMPRDKAKAREFQPYGTPTDAGPDPVLQTIESLRGQVSALMKRVEELEAPLDSGEQPTPRKRGGQSG